MPVESYTNYTEKYLPIFLLFNHYPTEAFCSYLFCSGKYFAKNTCSGNFVTNTKRFSWITIHVKIYNYLCFFINSITHQINNSIRRTYNYKNSENFVCLQRCRLEGVGGCSIAPPRKALPQPIFKDI